MFLLESGRQATSVRCCARRRSRSRGSHPSTISGLSSILATIDRGTLVLGGRGRRELASGARERQGARRGEGLRLRSVGRVRLNRLHLAPILCFENARFGSKTYFSNRPTSKNVRPSYFQLRRREQMVRDGRQNIWVVFRGKRQEGAPSASIYSWKVGQRCWKKTGGVCRTQRSSKAWTWTAGLLTRCGR